MDSLTLPKDMTEQEYRDAIIQMEATIAELDKSDAEKTQDIHNLRDRHSPETTNKMEPSTFPKPAADMTEQEARDATVQLEAAILELDEENENMTQRIRELLDEHESRRDELASWNLVSDTDADDVARVAVSTTPIQKSRLLPTDNARR
jgi:predicted  nucleic acid-binding Zn-ribbon protein